MPQVHRAIGDIRNFIPQARFAQLTSSGGGGGGGVALPDAEFTAMSQTIVEGNTITIRYFALLEGQADADFPDFDAWRDLDIASVSAQLQYKRTVTSADITDFQNSDILANNFNYHGEYESDADAGDVPSIRYLYYRTSDNQWRGVSTNNADGTTIWANFNQDTGLVQPVTWLGSLSDDELTTYFENNEYDSSRNYFFYQESSGQVRRYAESTSEEWTDFTSGDEHDGVAADELTVNDAQLRSRGIVRITLTDDSVDMNTDDFRVLITLND